MKIRLLSIAVIVLATGLAACAHPTPGAPTTYNPGCNTADLIHDINQANTDPGPAIIQLPGGCEYLFSLVDNTQLADGVDLPSGLPAISSDITIMGNNSILMAQAPGGGPAYFGIFFIEPAGYLQLHSLTLQDAWRALGAAVYNDQGRLYANAVIFRANHAIGEHTDLDAKGGAIYNRAGRVSIINGSQFISNTAANIDTRSSAGGGIYNDNGSVLISKSAFEDNYADLHGGAIALLREDGMRGYDGVLISDTSFQGNRAGLADGGAINADGENTVFAIAGSTFTSNTAKSHGGAIHLLRSDLSITGSEFLQNSADRGGAIYSDTGSELSLSHNLVESNSAQFGGGLFNDGARLEIAGDEYELNMAAVGGGGVFSAADLQIRDSTFSQNTAYNGGGLYAGTIPDVTTLSAPEVGIRTSTFYGNESVLLAGYWKQAGGGIFFAGAQLDLEKSTLYQNKSNMGGGLFAAGGRINIVNSTISWNLRNQGSGMYIATGAEANILHTTIADNHAIGGGSSLRVEGPTTLKNSIVTKIGDGMSCSISVAGMLTAQGENLDQENTCGFSLTMWYPGIDPLAANGGPTLTNKPTTSSPAVDAAADCGGLTEDQRGETRPYGAACDLGAVELGAYNPNPPVPPSPPDASTSETETPTVQGICEYRAIQNVNCRANDEQESTLIAILMEGDLAKLVSLNPEFTHGLFDTPNGKSCWVWLGLMEGSKDPYTDCKVPVNDPSPPESSALECSISLTKDQCLAAGGTWPDGVTTKPQCVCP